MNDVATVTGLLENAASGRGLVSILGGESDEVGIGDLWMRSERAAAFFLDRVGRDGVVGLLMETSLDCLVSLLGAWRSGITTLSLPYRARSEQPAAHRLELRDLVRLAEIDLVVLPERVTSLDLEGAVRTASFRSCAAHPRRSDVSAAGEFVQFSSGSTGRPKGVRLSSSAIAANVMAMIDHTGDSAESAITCSWLPLSHDMGLIGMCLAALAAMGPPWHGRRLALMPPARMVARPHRWLQACSEIRATVTAAPNFALDLVVANPRNMSIGVDLRQLRVLTVGSELIRPATLRRFAAAMAPLGFDEVALCPAYGMAEAALAVTMVAPHEHWHGTAAGGHGVDVVSCGRPLRGLEVRAPAGPGAIGPIAVRGSSLLTGYLGAGPLSLDEGWLATSDLGFMSDGELHVVGRADDVLVVAGTKLYPELLEETAARHEAVRPGNCAAISDGSGGYLIIAERRRANGGPDLYDACRWIRRELSEQGLAPTAVVLVSPGSIPKTTSGKLQRSRLLQMHGRGELEVEAELHFGRRS